MRDVTPTGPTPSRRLVTAGALGAAVALLTGCGIRLEDDAPRVPLVPARSPIDGEDALVRLLGAVQSAALAQVDSKAPISPLLAPLHARQATVLHDALRQRGVPADELPSATPSPSATSTAAPSASGTQTPAPSTSPSLPVAPPSVATVEGSIVTAGSGTSAAEAELRPTLISLLAQAHAALDLAAAAVPPPVPATMSPSPAPSTAPSATQTTTPTPTPNTSPTTTPRWSQPQSLAPLITAVRTATYFLQVAAARSPQAARAAGLEGIAKLQTITAEMVEAAGESAPAPELGFPLPHPVTTPAQAATLATQALTTLLNAFGSELASLSEKDADAAFSKVPQWLGTVAAQAHRHGIPLTPFPGLA